MFLKISQKFIWKHLYWSLFITNKAAGLRACNFIKKRLQHKCFPVNFAKFLRTSCLQNTSGRLLLDAVPLRFLSRAKPDPDFARPVIAHHWFFKAFSFTWSYLISKGRKSYLFAGKCVLLISIKYLHLTLF